MRDAVIILGAAAALLYLVSRRPREGKRYVAAPWDEAIPTSDPSIFGVFNLVKGTCRGTIRLVREGESVWQDVGTCPPETAAQFESERHLLEVLALE